MERLVSEITSVLVGGDVKLYSQTQSQWNRRCVFLDSLEVLCQKDGFRRRRFTEMIPSHFALYTDVSCSRIYNLKSATKFNSWPVEERYVFMTEISVLPFQSTLNH